VLRIKKLIKTIALILIFEIRNSVAMTSETKRVFAKKETMFMKNIDPGVEVD
jgi:hypothetical protein